MPRGLRAITALAGASAALLGGAAALARQPVAHAAANCGVGTGYGYGYSYLTSLTVRGTSCSTGRHVVRRHGRVSGWHCTKQRLGTNSIQYQERETCTKGSRRVKWTYTQNT